jgi:hypothetical protein
VPFFSPDNRNTKKSMTASVSKYRVYCTDESTYVVGWSSGIPGLCYNNAAHTIEESRTTLIETISSSFATTADSDHRLVVTSSTTPSTYRAQYTSCSDDFDNGIRYEGGNMSITHSDTDDATKVTIFRYIDPFYVTGASVECINGLKGDYLSVCVQAPATAVVPNGSNEGNCNVVGGMIVPVDDASGAFDVDLDASINANLDGVVFPSIKKVTAATPVPASRDLTTHETSGFFTLGDDTGELTPSYARDGTHNLFAAPIVLSRWIEKWSLWCPLSGNKSYEFTPHTQGAKMIPHWRVLVHTHYDAANHGAGEEIEIQICLNIARPTYTLNG